jgi:hypothetical protein
MKGLFDRNPLRRMMRQQPRIRENYVLEILLPKSGKLLTQRFGYGEWQELCDQYNRWIEETSTGVILWVDIIPTR